MLYPIELLGHKGACGNRSAMDGEHVNGHTRVCHVVLRLFTCRQTPQTYAASWIVQFASLQIAVSAQCNERQPQ